MSYYADTTWDITFRSADAKRTAKEELTALGWDFTDPFADGDDHWLGNIGQTGEDHWDGLTLTGNTNGKLYDLFDAVGIIAQHADGEITLSAEDSNDGHSKYVLSDGTARLVQGYIAYRDDRSPWQEIDGHPVADWQYEVANDDTRLGYLAWVDARQD